MTNRNPSHAAFHREVARIVQKRQYAEQVVPDKRPKFERTPKHKQKLVEPAE